MLAGEEKKPAWCYVTISEKEKDKIVTKYKKLYNSYTINDPRGIVPDGWRISTTEDPAEKLNPEDMNIDLSIFVEALESMDYSIVRRSKYDCSDQLWEGHNFEEGFLFKD